MIWEQNFMDLVWWILGPLAVLFALFALNDCGRTANFTKREKWIWGALIVALPIVGGIAWFRAKDRRRASQSSLMRRVRNRRGF